MINTHFFFSERINVRVARHLLFWFMLAIYFTVLQAANPALQPSSSYFSNLPSAFVRNSLLLIPQIFAAYSILYFVVPLYIRKRQLLLAFLSLVFIWVLSAGINIQMSKHINPHIIKWVLPEKYFRRLEMPPAENFIIGLLSVTKGVFTGAGFLVMLRYIKQWYVKEKRNLQLQNENAKSQLQLLTAQVHPHFLFNTLNNIYSQTQTESPTGSKMIMELSSMLRYILAESGKPEVQLEKEMEMVKDYINLEKIKYGNKLGVYLSLPRYKGSLKIAPLLLLPFVENCFPKQMRAEPEEHWVSIEVSVKGKKLSLKLMSPVNSSDSEDHIQPGNGFQNVIKRLELLYPGRHELNKADDAEVSVVNLWIELSEEHTGLEAYSEYGEGPVKIVNA